MLPAAGFLGGLEPVFPRHVEIALARKISLVVPEENRGKTHKN